jgi:hypothetical protein
MDVLTATPTPAARFPVLGRPIRWLKQVRQRRQSRLLADAFADVRRLLGRQMFAAGIDDGETGRQIAEIDAVLAREDLEGGEAQDLRSQLGLLLIRLADAALENDAPLPGADEEFVQALALKLALDAENLGNPYSTYATSLE